MSSSDLSSRFVTQDSLDEKRKRRQEEWEKKRTADDPIECPDEVVDNRSLYERLQEQKDKKDQEYQDQFALKNSVKGLQEDEVAFLDHVSDQQIAIEKARNNEEARVIRELREANVHTIQSSKPKEDKRPVKQQIGASQNKRSQQALLAGVVKRKSADSSDDSKKRKLSTEETAAQATTTTKPDGAQQTATVIGILPGLGAYNNDTSDSQSSSSDSEDETKIVPAKIYIKVNQEHE